jgi:predicted lactoylglutathione lyase
MTSLRRLLLKKFVMPQKAQKCWCVYLRESREAVDEMVRKAIAAGGTTYSEPHDQGFMYGHGFQDLDGHIWEIIYMEPSAST